MDKTRREDFIEDVPTEFDGEEVQVNYTGGKWMMLKIIVAAIIFALTAGCIKINPDNKPPEKVTPFEKDNHQDNKK